MVEQYLGKKAAAEIFYSSMISHLALEKRGAFHPIQAAKGIFENLSGIAGGAWGLAKDIPSAMLWLGATGAGAGALGALGYDAIKEHVTHEDPEAKLDAEIEAIYNAKKRELEDSRWISRVMAMRDELKRDGNKMTAEEYATKYNALVAALNERRD